MRRIALAVLVTALAFPSAALAQSADTSTPATIDPTKLGISVDRIRRELTERQFDSGSTEGGLRFTYRVEVYGQAPAIDVIGDFDIYNGPVPGSAPTHGDFLQQVTPQEYRAPAASISNVFFWAAQKLSEKNAQRRCEAELAEYRARIMAGQNVSPPTCAQ